MPFAFFRNATDQIYTEPSSVMEKEHTSGSGPDILTTPPPNSDLAAQLQQPGMVTTPFRTPKSVKGKRAPVPKSDNRILGKTLPQINL